MKFCCFCGSKLNWNGNHDISDYGDYDSEEVGVVSLYTCTNTSDCGAQFEATSLFEDNRYSNNKNTKQIICNWGD